VVVVVDRAEMAAVVVVVGLNKYYTKNMLNIVILLSDFMHLSDTRNCVVVKALTTNRLVVGSIPDGVIGIFQ
jgi:hypothetical protein